MGCGCGTLRSNQLKKELYKIDTVVGQLSVILLSVNLQNSINFLQKNTYAKLQVSNQQFKIQINNTSGKEIKDREPLKFTINSCFKMHGRMLTLEVWDEKLATKNQVGLGIIDLQPYLQNNVKIQEIKCFINHNRKQAGFIKMKLHFQEYPFNNLSFQINSLFIRHSIKGQRLCFCRITIGEQILETKPKKDSQDSVPSWKTEIKTFRVPDFIDEGLIEVFEERDGTDLHLGQVKLDVRRLMNTTRQLMHNEPIYFYQLITGSISFDTVKCKDDYYVFKDMQSPRKNTNKTNLKDAQSTKFINNTNISTSMPNIQEKIIPDKINRKNTLPPLKTKNLESKEQKRKDNIKTPTIKLLEIPKHLKAIKDKNKNQSEISQSNIEIKLTEPQSCHQQTCSPFFKLGKTQSIIIDDQDFIKQQNEAFEGRNNSEIECKPINSIVVRRSQINLRKKSPENKQQFDDLIYNRPIQSVIIKRQNLDLKKKQNLKRSQQRQVSIDSSNSSVKGLKPIHSVVFKRKDLVLQQPKIQKQNSNTKKLSLIKLLDFEDI